MESEYLHKLLLENRDVGERYRKKLKLIDNLDPFTFTIADLNYSIDGVPPVTNMDIVTYLVLSHSYYTKEQMKAYKSLQSYKYFESVFVVKAGTKVINDFYILVGKVKHSQRANLKPLDVWCIITKDGSISTAHCTCMAGNSEVCSHVGAILFAAEYANNKKEEVSCTDVQSVWLMPSMSAQVPNVPVREMNWGNASVHQENKEVPPISASELVNVLENISQLGYSSALMRILEPFCTQISEQTTNTVISVLDIFNENNINKSYSELMKLSRTIDISVSLEQISSIEEATRNQSENKNWYVERAGRITASRFKSVCRTNRYNPSLSLVKSICYPTKIHFTTAATSWGISHEHVAVEKYQKHMEEENHDSFIVNEVELLVSQKWPQLGASPDRLVFCECCLGGCLEVKCPYLLHTNNIRDINDYLSMKSSCLIKEDDHITLNKAHSYYYQVQMQIFVSQLLYCDFVIWSRHIFFKQRILPDLEFWEKEREIVLKFHSEVIMPELLGRYFTREAGAAKINRWCICKEVDDRRPMIKCDGDDCDIEWFHFECIGLLETPNDWYCSKCKADV